MNFKTSLFIPCLILSLASCQNGGEKHPSDEAADSSAAAMNEAKGPALAYFGNEITEDGAVDVSSVKTQLEGKDSLNVKVVGKVDKVCQVKGCWMTMAYDGDQSMRVSFRDYGFFVPKDIDGKDAVIDGTL